MTAPTGRADERLLIVNGDDFGRTPGINRGVRRAHEHGILTSASLMVRWPAAVEAAGYARERPALSVGLHLDLGEWVHRDGRWVPVYTVAPVDDAEAVAAEVTAQLETFRRLVGTDPTHVDSHQHVHLHEPTRSVLLEAVGPLGIPTRACNSRVNHCGDFHGQTGRGEPWPEGITVDALLRILATLPQGFTELGCHPGEDDDFDSPYRLERRTEVSVLCDARIRAAVDESLVRLTSFHQAPARTGSAPS
ncbi:carbohydrate deacetylase [Geodermatophilus sp. SYSU D00703]